GPRGVPTARPARPSRRARARRARGGTEARRQLGRTRARGAGVRGIRRRPGAARVADESRRGEHADVEADREAEEAAPVDLRRDGAAALEWAASYLERVGDFPVLAQVGPGEVRARLPASPPERGEPFADVLRDLDDVLLPGVTHWQSPRFFAYF